MGHTFNNTRTFPEYITQTNSIRVSEFKVGNTLVHDEKNFVHNAIAIRVSGEDVEFIFDYIFFFGLHWYKYTM